jgi:pimeloyl-ACP methyl ester carboxylesterase
LRCIPGAVLHVFRNVGHTPHWEVPAEFAAELVTLLRI